MNEGRPSKSLYNAAILVELADEAIPSEWNPLFELFSGSQ
jgi:hypothetical protein